MADFRLSPFWTHNARARQSLPHAWLRVQEHILFMRPDSLPRLWCYINLLLTYLLTYLLKVARTRLYLAVNDSAPVYLLSLHPSRWRAIRLWSSISDQLIVPPYNLATVGKQPFPVSAANLWNSVPAHLTSARTVAHGFPAALLFRRFCSHTPSLHSVVDLAVTLLFTSHWKSRWWWLWWRWALIMRGSIHGPLDH